MRAEGFGERLRRLRLEKFGSPLSLRDAASRLGITHPYLVQLEAGSEKPSEEPSVLTSKPAIGGRVKTGQRRPSGTSFFYPAEGCVGKSVLVRQLRGPHFSTCPWCRSRSSMALTAAADYPVLWDGTAASIARYI